MEPINHPSPDRAELSTSLAMQAGLALLDLVAALRPEQEAARHKLRTRLQTALSSAKEEHWLHRDLLQRMLDELDQR